ncbi:carbohydrate-binding module family 1 protein [Jaapia argillacea MUCL 33604]|uniref:Carbohydrate-binding module family 1 protein n=1 Tax=Jaapia argillacea MUCL 33604 TaxID=933084 RepID=A0A067P8B7_9AGAM|nr:carbohydrate-binding module family 1 protein [Jaapia argillacea MUCL 33604]
MARSALFFAVLTVVATAFAQTTAPQYGQCAGQSWTGPTTCPSGWTCTYSNPYYSQCLPGGTTSSTPKSSSISAISPPPATSITSSSSISVTTTSTASAASGTATLQAGYSFIRAVVGSHCSTLFPVLPLADTGLDVQEDPNFHKYLQSEVLQTASDAVLGSPATAAQFIISNGQLIQQNSPSMAPLYAVVEGRANSTVTKLKMSWSTTPASGANAGTFMWSGDTLEWSIPTISRPQLNAWLVCPDAAGHPLVYINLGSYDYQTPAGCADETIHAYTGATATP